MSSCAPDTTISGIKTLSSDCSKRLTSNKILTFQCPHLVPMRDNNGWTALHEAANHNLPDAIQVLIDAGANINDRGGEGCDGLTPLHDACYNGCADVIRVLVENGASLTAKDDTVSLCPIAIMRQVAFDLKPYALN